MIGGLLGPQEILVKVAFSENAEIRYSWYNRAARGRRPSRSLSMISSSRHIILLADDDPDGRLLAEEAFKECGFGDSLFTVSDGDDLLHFLLKTGRYQGVDIPRPDLILLDLNMPRMGGSEVLERIKDVESLRSIPVIALTTSDSEEDVRSIYELGGSSYVTKPPSFDGFVKVMREILSYWFEVVKLPQRRDE